MRDSINLNAPSYVPALIGTDTPANSLLASLFGRAAQIQSTVDPIAALEQARDGKAHQIALIAAEPRVQRDIAQFTEMMAAAKMPTQLLADPAVLKILLTASGLGRRPGDTTKAMRELLSNPRRPSAIADPGWVRVTNACSFPANGLPGLRDSSTIAAIADLYLEALWRAGLDQTTPGLANALDFQQRAATIISADQVFADPAFHAVITTVFDIPGQVVFLTVEAREQAISTRVDLTRFADPAFVTQIAQRYLIAAQDAASQGSETGHPETEQTASRASMR